MGGSRAKKREKGIKVFPNTESAISLMGAVLLNHHDDWNSMYRLFSMTEYLETRKQVVPLLSIA